MPFVTKIEWHFPPEIESFQQASSLQGPRAPSPQDYVWAHVYGGGGGVLL